MLDAAVELFLSGGFDRTSMDAVAAHAGVSKTTVYAHFGDKLELFRAVTERSGTALDLALDEAALASDGDPEDRLTHVVLKVLQATSSPQFLAFLRVMMAESNRHPELIETMRTLGVPHVVDVVAATLREDAVRHGYHLPDPESYAGLFIRMAAAGVQMDALIALGQELDHAFLEGLARWTAAVFLRALRNRDAGELPKVPDGAGDVLSWAPPRRR
ncbi:TetR/AcrR family transcriptional regulator [Streptomyces sp. DSM 15324]|uniref:TetR/AcrR family transcriptional regulator n=1 Tax=Streptomyces sp. DSM 15324 TaxID=1739111 RepID=UPI001F19339D|nr:TetR/AcrR family transcriptional regulator [Streptomyces sp. DSM 15324]